MIELICKCGLWELSSMMIFRKQNTSCQLVPTVWVHVNLSATTEHQFIKTPLQLRLIRGNFLKNKTNKQKPSLVSISLNLGVKWKCLHRGTQWGGHSLVTSQLTVKHISVRWFCQARAVCNSLWLRFLYLERKQAAASSLRHVVHFIS